MIRKFAYASSLGLCITALVQAACGNSPKLTELEHAKAGTLEVVLLSANGEFSMAGRWRLTVEWDGGPAPGSVSFSRSVE